MGFEHISVLSHGYHMLATPIDVHVHMNLFLLILFETNLLHYFGVKHLI
jgi:hypothetical protein